VKEQLLKKFAEEAFSENAFAADIVLNEFLTRDVLAWGDQLLAEDAANAAVADAELEEEALRLFAPEEHEGDEAAEAAPASAPAAANVNSDTAFEPAAAAPAPAAPAVPAFTFGAAAPPVAAPPAAPEPQSQKDEDHAKLIATVQWPNVYAATGVDGVTRHSGSLLTCRKYSKLAEGHERDLVHELRDYEASGGDLDAIRQHIDDAASACVWEKFLINYKSFLRTGDDAAVEAHGSLAGSSVEVSPARSQDIEDEDEGGSFSQWDKTTAPLLSRVRNLTLPILFPAKEQPNEHEIACAKQVWAYLRVEMEGHDKTKNWSFVERALRPQVRETLELLFDKDAFSEDKKAARAARDKFEKADLLKWGDCLLFMAEHKEETIAKVGVLYGVDQAETLNDLEKFYDHLGETEKRLGEHAMQRDTLVRMLPILEQTYGRDHATVHITRKKIISLEQEQGLDHANVRSALENAANADLMREDIGSWACSGSVENVAKCSWKSRSRDGSSRGGDRRSRLPSDSASLDQFGMELDSESLLNEAMSSNLSMVDS